MVFSASWQLSENAPQPEEERDRAEAGGEKAAAGVAAARTGLGSRLSREVLHLTDDLALGRLLAEKEPGKAMIKISPGASAKTV
jgi:hypothetical protein